MGGSFKTFVLPECRLFFYANTGMYNLEVGNLGFKIVSPLMVVCVQQFLSVLGIDILNKFNISYSDDLDSFWHK